MGLIHKITFVPRFIRQVFYLPFNRLMFKSAGACIGSNFNVNNRFYLKLYPKGTLTIGDDFTIYSGEAINPITRNIKGCFFINRGANLTIGHIPSDCIAAGNPCKVIKKIVRWKRK